MKLRVARHCNRLQTITAFYQTVIGLEILGSFTDHEGYDGVFLGMPGSDWHLEFTVSDEAPVHRPDEDDLLVFYCDAEQYRQLIARLENAGYHPVKAKNPYWDNHGSIFIDPDGYRIVVSPDE